MWHTFVYWTPEGSGTVTPSDYILVAEVAGGVLEAAILNTLETDMDEQIREAEVEAMLSATLTDEELTADGG